MTDDLRKYAKIINEAYGDDEGPGYENQAAINELYRDLEELSYSIEEVISSAKKLARVANAAGAPRVFAGQIEAYMIPWMQAFIDSTHQPGSVASLERILNNGG